MYNLRYLEDANLKNLKDIKYYVVYWKGRCYDGTQWGGFVDNFATRKEAEQCVIKEKARGTGSSYTIHEKSILELMEEICNCARKEERHNKDYDNSMYYKEVWRKKYEEKLEEEKQKLRQEMRDFIENWFSIQTEVES